MNKSDKQLIAYIEDLYDFRQRIPAFLSKGKIEEVWDIKVKGGRYKDISDRQRGIINRKISILKDSLEWIVLKPFVQFIGVSGSVASEFVKEKDDIDLFIVTRNDTLWIYRLYLYFRNISKRRIRSRSKQSDVKDKFCVNFLTEERNLLLENDMFNLNELLFLKPVYYSAFLSVIFLQNDWLREKYLVSRKFLRRESLKVGMLKTIMKRNCIFFIINLICFLLQVGYMVVMKHDPDIQRLVNGFRSGRVEFFPKGFREEKLGKT